MHHEEEIIRILDLIIDDTRSPQIIIDVAHLFILLESLSVQFTHVGY